MSRSRRATMLCTTIMTFLFLAVAGAAQAQTTTTQVTGEVVQVMGNDLVVKLTTGEFKSFHVPEARRFEIDGKDVSVHELQPGTTLTATVKTTTTPVTTRTKKVVNGRVWYVAPPTVILTLENGENKQYTVRDQDNVRFIVSGQPATIFDLRKNMVVSAEKIVEEPGVEITTDTKVVGHAPAPAAAAPPAAGGAAPAAGGSPAAGGAPPAAGGAPAGGETPAAAPAGDQPAGTPPAEPEQGGGMSTMMWIGLIVVVIAIAIFWFSRSRAKK
jgi:hypothetical protein